MDTAASSRWMVGPRADLPSIFADGRGSRDRHRKPISILDPRTLEEDRLVMEGIEVPVA